MQLWSIMILCGR